MHEVKVKHFLRKPTGELVSIGLYSWLVTPTDRKTGGNPRRKMGEKTEIKLIILKWIKQYIMMNSLHYPRKGFTFGRKMFITYVRTFWLCLFINLEKMKMKMSETSSVVSRKSTKTIRTMDIWRTLIYLWRKLEICRKWL